MLVRDSGRVFRFFFFALSLPLVFSSEQGEELAAGDRIQFVSSSEDHNRADTVLFCETLSRLFAERGRQGFQTLGMRDQDFRSDTVAEGLYGIREFGGSIPRV
jgi:hypothetical protein